MFGTMIVEVILASLVVLWLAYKYCTWEYAYWKDRSVPYIEPHFPFGTEKDFLLHTKSFGKHYQNQYNKIKNAKMIGAFMVNRPFLIIKDPELIKLVMVKDFNHFVDRGLYDPQFLHPVARNLFLIEGEIWRNIRIKLTPTFTSGKIKMMYHLMKTCVEELRIALHPVAEQNGNLDVKDFVTRFMTDVIASCAFGLETNSFRNPESEIRQKLAGLYKFLRVQRLPIGYNDFFRKVISDTVEYRKKDGVIRNDFIDLLMKIKHNKNLSGDKYDTDNGINANVGNTAEGFTLDEITAHSLIFLLAGFETASSVTTFCLYELSLNSDVQERLHKEVNDVLQKHSGKFSYQALQEMPYLEAVINETMRRYVSLGILNRKCTADYKFPDTNFVVPKGMNLVIPVYAIHHDPEYYPDPYKFDPERFMNDATKTRNNFTFLPFGEGPRMCIANRFGMLQMKTCLSTMINSYRFSITKDTPIPIKINKVIFITAPETPIILEISNRGDA